MHTTFIENFDEMPALANGDGAPGKWAPHLDGGYSNGKFTGYDWMVKRYQPMGNDQQIYTDSNFKGSGEEVLNLNPFSVDGSVLTITGDRTPPALLRSVWNQAYTSGLLSSHEMFAQTYGYFEMSAKVPSSQALLPAFWMLPVDRSWPPEIDILEAPGHMPDKLTRAVHWVSPDTSAHASSGCYTPTPAFADGFHTYGVLWLPDRIVYYYDRMVVAQVATKPGMDKPFYLMINMAVGGRWQGAANQNTPLPQRMLVDWVAVYSVAGPKGCLTDWRGVLLCR
ncbi:family 16 glycosylhydrolase [Herbaspirillum sp. alder98]|uniref:glycoside hydrolase family 16 protein n=1 Tax=Herbaspirillum sp. alder98 TaxID=2913096 RepID=UPI001CD87EE0|nr:glycoside hydrolase family 16 protein [Herbaspirillum sp. alder98]MCA1326028.1 glycoside hydrolase family 16 protein [Herbaspirillum sp. alder98]